MRCELCLEVIPDEHGDVPESTIEHIRLLHPDVWDGPPDTWPDGQPVIINDTLTPEDFGEP